MTENEAISVAEAEAAKNDWPWHEPIRASRRRSLFQGAKWEVVSNADRIGCNVRVLIDDGDGSVITAAFCPR
jgi:hypothetical protein